MDQDDNDRSVSSLAAARCSLRAGMEKSRALGRALAGAGPHLKEIQVALQALEAAICPIRAPRAEVTAAGPHIDRAVVHGLEPPLLANGAVARELPGYLVVLGRLEEALRFLSDNCGLAAQWLADIVEYLSDRGIADLGVTLDELKNPSGDLDGGLLAAALDMLKAEYHRILADHSAPLTMQQLITTSASIAPSPIPPPLSTISA